MKAERTLLIEIDFDETYDGFTPERVFYEIANAMPGVFSDEGGEPIAVLAELWISHLHSQLEQEVERLSGRIETAHIADRLEALLTQDPERKGESK